MATLEDIATGARIRLRPTHLVGRSERADLQLEHRRVSTEHASIRWTGRGWIVRDLGSRNHTWVDGNPLEVASSALLTPGTTLGFGSADASHRVLDVAGPSVSATVDGEELVGVGDMLALPDEQDPVVVVVRSGEGWVVEGEDAERPIEDGALLEVAGRNYRVSLPEVPIQTWASDDASQYRLADVGLHFRVSLDEEHVELALELPGTRQELGTRAHHYLLLTLARLRLEDAERPDLPESAHGWVAQESLEKMLARHGGALHIAVFRARRELSELGLVDGKDVVERRKGSRQLRLGVARIGIEAI